MIFKKNPFETVRKRDGRLVPFDESRIVKAISRAMQVVEEGDAKEDAEKVAVLRRRVRDTGVAEQHGKNR